MQVLRVLWYCMSYGNSCANPIIYNYASSDFRAGFRRAMHRLLVCLPSQRDGAGSIAPAAAETTRYRAAAGSDAINTAVRLTPRLPTALTAVRL